MTPDDYIAMMEVLETISYAASMLVVEVAFIVGLMITKK